MEKIDIKDLSAAELCRSLKESGFPEYRAKQIFRWLYKTPVEKFSLMSDLPSALRDLCEKKFLLSGLKPVDIIRSHSAGTAKYLFALGDGNTIESVLIPDRTRATVCLSTQVGCKFACDFCASAPFGFVRNLTQGEITGQATAIKTNNPGANITNLVFMGIGEPLDNYDNVIGAVRIFNDPDAFNIGARRMTVSTCGVVPGIKRLSEEGIQVELSVSLHSADDDVRSRLLPVNRRYGIKDLIASCKEYTKATNRVVTFEYVLIKNVNSSVRDAERLCALLKGMKCKVNAISYNAVPGRGYLAPTEKEADAFMRTLEKHKVRATRRRPKGDDIDAGCGQLRISKLKK